jgi:hypothetical protein
MRGPAPAYDPDMARVRFVVISGIPGSGKSTVGERIATLLGLDVIDKDVILEASLPGGVVDPETRDRLSRQADHAMRTKVQVSRGAVLISHWRRPELSMASGTPTEWLTMLPDLVEVHCVCSPSTAARRFLDRERHRGHGDERHDPGDLLERFHALADLGPLGIGTTVTVDTEGDLDVMAVVRAVTSD